MKPILKFLLLLAVIINPDVQAGTREVKQMIVEEASALGFDPALALAVARVESNFDPSAVSSAGAIGVMQMMPQTARGEFGVSRYRLFNPRINIRLGIRYLQRLLAQYNGRVDIALSHYNGGASVKTASGRLRVIPATYRYVDKVLELYGRKARVFERFPRSPTAQHHNDVSVLDDFSRNLIATPCIDVFTNERPADPRLAQLESIKQKNMARYFGQRKNKSALRISPRCEKAQQSRSQKIRQRVLQWESVYNKTSMVSLLQ